MDLDRERPLPPTEPDPVWHERFRALSRAAAVVCAVGGMAVTAGWATGMTLAERFPAWIPIKANSALGLVLGGVALWSLQDRPGRDVRGRHVLARACGAAIALIGALTLLQHLFGVDLGIDELLFHAPTSLSRDHALAARMSPLAAVNLLFTGLAIVLLATRSEMDQSIAQLLLIASCAIDLVAMLGAVFGASFHLGVASYAHLPLNTALCWALLGFGLLLSRPDRGPLALVASAGPAGHMARQLLPVALFAPIALGGLRLLGQHWQVFDVAFGTTLSSVSMCLIFLVQAWWSARSMNLAVRRQRLAESQVARARDEAVQASRAKSDFLANMSHEIRTPMNGVLGMTGLLLDTELSPGQRDYAETIKRCANSLLDLINDILDLSKIEAGKLSLEPLPFDIRDVIEEVADMVSLRAQEKGVELVVRLVPRTPRWLVGDGGRMRQVILNLAGNAVKFTKAGRVVLTVQEQPGAAQGFHRMQVSVEDTGIGIAPEQLPLLFQKFQQADASTTRRFGGTGLGLVISRQLVEAMGGSIHVESTAGKGSRFWFQVELPASGPSEFTDANEVPNLREMRALVVDDDDVARSVLIEEIAGCGLRAEGAVDGPAALVRLGEAAAAGHRFDVVLIDHRMPGMDGPAVARAIAATPELAQTAVILLSHLGVSGVREEDLKLFTRLVKPVRTNDLREALVAIRKSERPTGRRRALQSPEAPAYHAPAGTRALVVEDNPVNQTVAVRMLERLGCRADLAGNGEEALRMMELLPYDVIFMDCQMPVLDGYEATAAIREREAGRGRRPVIGMTANAMAGDREHCLAAGMDDYLTKPVSMRMLEGALARWLSPGGPVEALPVDVTPATRTGAPTASGGAAPMTEELSPADPSFDRTALDALADMAGDQARVFVEQLIATYQGSAVKHLAALESTIAANDAKGVQEAAHALKGSAANLGLRRTVQISAWMEDKGRTAVLGPVAPVMLVLTAEFERTRSLLADYLATLK